MDRRAAGALLALAACFATATAAPTSNHTALDLYDGPAEGCYYNFQHYGEGDRIMTNEPCLNCTCHNRMLMCYLRVCPFTKPIGQDCTVEKRADQCCPIVTCPDVPVDLLTSTSTTSPAEYGGGGIGKVDNYGCSINGKYFPEGAKVPPTPNKPCEHCYCIRNMTTCVMQECTLHVDGCTPIYHKDVCCPVRYFCDHPEDETLQLDDMTTTVRPTPGFLLTTTTTETPTTEIQAKRECIDDGQTYPDGALIKTEKPCVHCYCMKGDIVCVVQECGTPMENEGKNCTSMPPREGQCCPDTYICEGDEITTETLLEEITTLMPPESTTRRGSVVRKEPGVTYTESTTGLGVEGSGEEELLTSTLESSDLSTPKVDTEDRFGVTDQMSFSAITTESPAYEVKEQATSEPDKDLNTVPSDTSEDDHSEQSILEHTTNAEIMTTESPVSIIQETSPIDIDQKQGSEVPETTSIDEKIEEASTTPSVQIEDESTQVSLTDEDKVTPLLDESRTTPPNVISELTSEPLLTQQTTQKSDSVTEVNLTTLESETPLLDQSKTTPLNVVSMQTSEPILPEQTTLKSELVTELKLTTLENDTSLLDQFRTTTSNIISEGTTEPILTEQTTLKSDSVTTVKLTTLEKDTSEPTETIPKDVFSEETVTEFTEHSSEPSIEEKRTTIHELLEVTESSATSKEKEITSTSVLEETTTSVLEGTESVVPIKEHTTHKDISPEESSEPSLFDENPSSDAVTESDKNRTTISSIYEDDFTISTTPKIGEGVKKSTELTTAEVDKASTTENLVEEIVTTPEPSHEQNLVPDVGSEGKITTKPIPDQHIYKESIPTYAPFTEVVPQDDKQDTTEANVITTLRPSDEIQPAETTTTLNPKDNEISEDILPPGRIPGEGECLFNGVTYRNESSVPNINKCESSCKCISSIIKCDRIICSPPPEYMEDCQLVYDTIESCCPTYICEEKKETIPPQSHSQMSGTESPTLPPNVQCNGDDCKLIVEKQPTTIHPDLTIIPSGDDCGSEGCKGKIPEKTNISVKEPEKCIGDKCTDCIDGDCQLPSSQETPQHISTETSPQKCQGSDECREDETNIPVCEGEGCISITSTTPYEIPTPCEGAACISETPTFPEIPTPCKGDSCPEVLQGCTSDKCIASDNVPPKTSEISEICSDGKDCTQFEEKDCVDDNCRRHKDRIKPPSQPLPPKCIGQDCPQQEPSPDEEILLATTDQTLLEVSTLLPSSHSTLIKDTTYELPNTVTDSITEKTTQSTADHKEPESLYTETSEGAITTQTPQVTEALEEENTVPGKQITDSKIHHSERPTSATEVYTDKVVTENTKETEIERTESSSVTENREEFTSRPIESETQREDLSTRTPESNIDESKTEKETEKQQTPLSEFKPTQPQDLFTKAPDVDQPEVSTDSNIHDEQTETSDQLLSSTSIPSLQQDISESKTTPEYIEQSTTPPELIEKVEEPQNIPSSSGDIELTETPKEQDDTTTLSPELEKKTTKPTPSESEKEAPQEITTRTQEISTTSTEKPITQEEMKTNLPADFVTDSLKPVKEPTGTEISISTEGALYDTESPLETVREDKVTTEISEIITKRTESPSLEEQTEQIDSHPTTPQSITTETTKNPIENITVEHEDQEKEQRPEMQITESSLALDTKPSEEPVETVEPENLTEKVSNIPEPTEPTTVQESTSKKEIQTDIPMELGNELSIPVSITEQPIKDTKETDESQTCENETECKKNQVPVAEMTPCQGDSCAVEKEVGTDLSVPVSITEQPSIDTKETDESQMCENETECKKNQVPVAEMTPCQGDSCVVEKENGTELSIPVSITEQPSIDNKETDESQMCENETECKKTEVPVAEMIPCQGDSCVVEKENGTELSIPVSITEQPSIDTKETDESQMCENETECKKTQVPVAEMTPCQGDSCVVEKENGTELSIPVSITEQPSIDNKETDESQMCENETECNKTQVPVAEKTPCQGDSCVLEKEGCESSECIQSSLPPKTTPTDICDKENGCIQPTHEECTEETCKKSEVPSLDHNELDTEITTKASGILEEELHTEITYEPHVTEKEVPTTEMLSLDSDKTTKEPFSEEPEKGITELPESLITSAPLATESHKYDISEQTDFTQLEESITPKYEITTKGPHELDTEHPSSHETTLQQEISMAPQEQFPTEQQREVTESPVPVEITEVKDSSTLAPELPKITERGDEVTEEPKITNPEEHDLTAKPGIGETLKPEQQEPEISHPEVTTTGYSEITSIPTQDHDEERNTKRPEISTTPDLSTRKPETTVIQQSEDEVPETTEADITEIPRISEASTEPEHEFTETTPLLVELEEHTHKMEESITPLPSEGPFTQETSNIHNTEKEPIEIATQKPSQTDSTLQYTEKLPDDSISSETLRPDLATISDENLDKTTEPFTTKETSSQPSKSTSSDIQVPDSKFTTESKDQDEVSTVASTFSETKQTTHIPSETEKPQTAMEDDVPQTIHDTLSSTAGTLESTAPEEEFMQVTTKTTTPKTDEDVATQSPSAFDNYTKSETSTDVYPSTHAAETQKPVFSDTSPTDEAPQPEEESHFPPSGSYEPEPDYPEEEFGPGTCRYGGKVYVSAQQIPRDDPCDFCFCFRSDIICLQQSCPPPIHGCHEEPIQGFCCPRYECPVSMATTLNVTTTTTTTTTTLPPHFLPHAYKGAAQRRGCQIKGHIYKVGEVVRASSGPCLHCTCGGDGQMKCDPKVCTPEPMLRQMIAAAVSAKRRR